MLGPQNKKDAVAYRYGEWAGNPKGRAYDPALCAAEIPYGPGGYLYTQCSRQPGHGPDALFCKQHAKKIAP